MQIISNHFTIVLRKITWSTCVHWIFKHMHAFPCDIRFSFTGWNLKSVKWKEPGITSLPIVPNSVLPPPPQHTHWFLCRVNLSLIIWDLGLLGTRKMAWIKEAMKWVLKASTNESNLLVLKQEREPRPDLRSLKRLLFLSVFLKIFLLKFQTSCLQDAEEHFPSFACLLFCRNCQVYYPLSEAQICERSCFDVCFFGWF